MPERGSFVTVSSIDPGDEASWDGRLLLTFDLDWAHDEVIADTIELVEEAGVAATWFVTHDTPVLDRLRANPRFELGLHPNFNPLLNGDPAMGATAEEVIDRLLAVVPEARSVRSHSLVQGGRILELFRKKGLTHDCNVFIPEQSGASLRPWIDWFGMVRVPYFWEDDFWCAAPRKAGLAELLARDGLHAFDFHPIHLYLNTEHLDRYEGARESWAAPERLIGHRCGGAGTRSFLLDLLGGME
jgi:hypothetical protein